MGVKLGLSHTEGSTQAEGVTEENGEKDIWAYMGRCNRGLHDTA